MLGDQPRGDRVYAGGICDVELDPHYWRAGRLRVNASTLVVLATARSAAISSSVAELSSSRRRYAFQHRVRDHSHSTPCWRKADSNFGTAVNNAAVLILRNARVRWMRLRTSAQRATSI
jgi:hypothetical protein